VVKNLGGDLGLSVGTWPHVTEKPGGGFAWELTATVSFSKNGGTSVEPSSDGDLPEGAESFSSDGTTDFAWLRADDPADTNLPKGSTGGTEVFRRTAKGPWTSSGLVGSGPGGEVIADIGKTATGWVAAGVSYFYAAEGSTVQGYIKESTDGINWTEATVLDKPVGDFQLTKVCAGPAAVPVIVGVGASVGTNAAPLIARRLTDGNWKVLSNILRPEAQIITCIADADGVRIWAVENLKTALYISKDGNAFTRSDVVFDDATHSGLGIVSAGPKGYVAVGSKNVKGLGQVAVRTSSDGVIWQELPIKPTEPNAPDRSVYGALVVGTALHVVIDDRGVAKLWSIKLS
jgi:hypothetical protein